MIELRASRGPLAYKCPASLVETEIKAISDGDEEARLGEGVHAILADLIRDGNADRLGLLLGQGEGRYGVEADDMEPLVRNGWKIWRSIEHEYPGPQCEVTFERSAWGLRVVGHPDLFGGVVETLGLIDWKSGRLEDDWETQLRLYAWLLFGNFSVVNLVIASVILLRSMERIKYVWTREEIDAWFERFAERIKQTTSYNPGRHCAWCPRRITCPGKNALVRESLANAMEHKTLAANLATMDGKQLNQVRVQMKIVEEVAGQLLDFINDEIQARGGLVPVDEHSELVMREIVTKKLNYPLSKDVLRRYLSPFQIDDCVSIAKSKVEAELKATVYTGEKYKLVAQVMQELKECGALVDHGVQRRVELHIIPQQLGVKK